MNDINLRSEHIGRYQARLKHLDELLERARQKKIEQAEHEAELKELAEKREELARHLGQMEQVPAKDWQEEEIEKAGGMALWDAVALQLEKLVERLEKK
jgi:cell wall assembly regulator SMI1